MKSLTLLVCLAAIPALGKLGPYIEVPVAPPTIARAAGTQYEPHVATDGHDFFAVWLDSRGGLISVYGTRILADGTVLDPTGILIADPGVSCESPALVWDGANYVVVWREQQPLAPYDNVARFVRVDRSGRLLGGPKTLIDTYYTGLPSIASNGHGSMVIFSKPVGTVVLISQDGSITQKNAFPQMVGETIQIASNGDGYLLSWTDLQTTLLHLDNNGNVVGPKQQLNERGAYTQLIARIGGPYLLVGRTWDGEGSCSRRIVGRLVTSSGVSAPFVIHNAGSLDISDIAVTADPSGFQVVWMKRLGAYECGPVNDSDPPSHHGPWPPFGLAQIHVGEDGTSGKPVTVSEGTGFDQAPSVAQNGAAELLLWIQTAYAGRPSKVAAAIGRSGESMMPFPITSSAAWQDQPTVAVAESTFMTVWKEESSLDERTAIYARRFSADGRAIDAAPIKVSADFHAFNDGPKVSFDGAVWLFLWNADYKMVARRMAADGKWIDAAPFPLGSPKTSFDYTVASNGNGFAALVATNGPALTLTSIPRSGDVHSVPVAVNFGLTRFATFPAMAWDGKAYVAVWSRTYSEGIEGIRFDPDGQVITPLFSVTPQGGFPSIDCHEGACAVAWQLGVARLIGGTVIPLNLRISPSAPNKYEYYPTVVAIGSRFQLFWHERGGPKPSLFTASINAAGIDSPNLVGPAGPYGSIAAAVTTHGQQGLALFHPSNDAADGGVMRVFLRILPAPEGERGRAVGR